jgi:hypothetical protein
MIKRKRKTPLRPSEAETRVLRLIALHRGLVCTNTCGGREYSTAQGVHISTPIAEKLIRNEWLVGQQESALFGARPQLYLARRP